MVSQAAEATLIPLEYPVVLDNKHPTTSIPRSLQLLDYNRKPPAVQRISTTKFALQQVVPRLGLPLYVHTTLAAAFSLIDV